MFVRILGTIYSLITTRKTASKNILMKMETHEHIKYFQSSLKASPSVSYFQIQFVTNISIQLEGLIFVTVLQTAN